MKNIYKHEETSMTNNLPESFFEAETRSGFYVEEKIKRIWAVELGILEEFDRVCKKYNLKYMAGYGTLLGAVRHKGFIPWDDDMDFVMFRDDYNKLLEIAEEEFKSPFSFLTTYNGHFLYAFSKIRDSRTTAIENELFNLPPDCNQGIFIDIFPLDDVPDGQPVKENIYKIQTELWYIMYRPQIMKKLYAEGKEFILGRDIVSDLLKMDIRDQFREYERLCTSNFGTSEMVDYIVDEILVGAKSKKREWYEEIVYLDFENIKIPCPVGYDEILKVRYGDYMTPVIGGSSHDGIFQDPDRPYTEYLINE